MNAEAPTQYALVDVGCMECGESTQVLGVFQERAEAEAAFLAAAAERELDAGGEWDVTYFTGGQRCLELFTVAARMADAQ